MVSSNRNCTGFDQTVTQMLLIRHGETEWNQLKRVQGHSDIQLNETGLKQAESLAEKLSLHHGDLASTIYSSDLQRARVTAEKTLEALKVTRTGPITIQTHESLREYKFGVAEGLTDSEIRTLYRDKDIQLKQTYPDRKERWNHTSVPESETFNELVARTKKTLHEIALKHPGEKIAIFVHGRLINTLIADTENLQTDTAHLPNCAVVHFRFSHENTSNPFKYIKTENMIG